MLKSLFFAFPSMSVDKSRKNYILGALSHIIVSYLSHVISYTGKTMSPQLLFHNAASNIICQVLFGARFEYDDPFIKTLVQCFTENAKLANGAWAMVSQRLTSLTLKFQQG